MYYKILINMKHSLVEFNFRAFHLTLILYTSLYYKIYVCLTNNTLNIKHSKGAVEEKTYINIP